MTMTTLKIHPAADWLPQLNGSEFQELKADIASRGLREPILRKDGFILDGRHRLRICNELEIEPIFEEYAGTDIVAEIASRNLFRRHLTPRERAELVVKMCGDQLSKEAQERSAANLKKGDESPDGTKRNHRETGRTREQIASIAKVSASTAQRALRAHSDGAERKPLSKAKVEKIEAAIERIRKVCGKALAEAVERSSRGWRSPQDAQRPRGVHGADRRGDESAARADRDRLEAEKGAALQGEKPDAESQDQGFGEQGSELRIQPDHRHRRVAIQCHADKERRMKTKLFFASAARAIANGRPLRSRPAFSWCDSKRTAGRLFFCSETIPNQKDRQK